MKNYENLTNQNLDLHSFLPLILQNEDEIGEEGVKGIENFSNEKKNGEKNGKIDRTNR